MQRHIRRALLLLIAGSVLIAGCDAGGPPAVPTASPPPPTPTPTPAALAAQIGQATQRAQSFHFDIAVGGAPVYADSSGIFALSGIAGDLRRPDGVLATVKVGGGSGTSEIKLVSLAGKQYITNPITTAWQCVPPGELFDPAVLFDPAKGFEYVLQQGYRNVALVGTEDINGQPNIHLTGRIDGDLLKPISGEQIGAGPVKADVWADAATLRATQVVLVDPASGARDATTWDVLFSAYDTPVDVQAPPGAPC